MSQPAFGFSSWFSLYELGLIKETTFKTENDRLSHWEKKPNHLQQILDQYGNSHDIRVTSVIFLSEII